MNECEAKGECLNVGVDWICMPPLEKILFWWWLGQAKDGRVGIGRAKLCGCKPCFFYYCPKMPCKRFEKTT